MPGKRALTDGMAPRSNGLTALSATKPKGDTYLRDLIKATPGIPDQVAVTTTVEFASFVDPDLVWKWKLRVSGDEAVLACVLILDAMRAGASINWHMEALGYLNQARSELGKPTQPEAEARPEDLVSLPDGGVSELEQSEEGPAEEGPQVSELEEPEVLPGTPDKPPTMKHTDPGIPGLGSLVDEAEELAGDLEGQGDLEDSFATKLLQLVDENKGRIITLGILIGGYALGAKYLGGRVVFNWGWNATGVEFERHLARSLQVTEELEEGLRQIEEVKATLEELDTNPKAGGPGINWKTQKARWNRRAQAQIDPMACGPSCVKMVLEDHGIEAGILGRVRAVLVRQRSLGESEGPMSNTLHAIRKLSDSVYELDVEWDGRREWVRFEFNDGIIQASKEFFLTSGAFMRPVSAAFADYVSGRPCPLPQTLVPQGS